MYKVFFNDSTILIGSEVKKSLNDNIGKMFDFCDQSSVNQIIKEIETTKRQISFDLVGNDCFRMWNHFKSCFTEMPAAGGLVVNSRRELLFIYRFGFWDLPKGKIEAGETAEFAAIREVEEECGISCLKVVKPLESTFHIYRSPFLPAERNLVLKETKWFLMEYSGSQSPVPQTEEDIVEIRWFGLDEMEQVYQNTYLSLRDFLDKSLPTI